MPSRKSGDELSEQIAGIESDIKRAKDGHELSVALEDLDQAELALSDARDRCGAAVAGALLTKWVRTVAIERSRPQVFRRASDLLVRFTRGTLTLELDDHPKQPTFLARQGSGPARQVQELSVGERVQLLMAVRMAFLEQDEPARLPILMDEILGTSDDGRAGVIIDTVLEIAREGRQVFYFTAQHDEVGKWVARLQDSGIAYDVIDLAQVRHQSLPTIEPLEIAAPDSPAPIAPDDMSHEEYGRALGVPTIDPTADDLGSLHLWHVLDDVDLLHQLLCRRIVFWSQLRALLRHGGVGLVDTSGAQYERASVAARAVDTACRAWRIGRGRPVDREVLLDADCVSDKFVDVLAALAQENDGDAATLLQKLEAGGVRYWRSDKTDQLREFLRERGYLSDDGQLSPDDIRVRVMASVADEIRDGLITQSYVDRLIQVLPP